MPLLTLCCGSGVFVQEKHIGRRRYLAVHALGHDYELEQAWLRQLVRDGRVSDVEHCFG